MKLSVHMYFFLTSSFFVAFAVSLKTKKPFNNLWSIFVRNFFFVHTDVGQILKKSSANGIKVL